MTSRNSNVAADDAHVPVEADAHTRATREVSGFFLGNYITVIHVVYFLVLACR